MKVFILSTVVVGLVFATFNPKKDYDMSNKGKGKVFGTNSNLADLQLIETDTPRAILKAALLKMDARDRATKNEEEITETLLKANIKVLNNTEKNRRPVSRRQKELKKEKKQAITIENPLELEEAKKVEEFEALLASLTEHLEKKKASNAVATAEAKSAALQLDKTEAVPKVLSSFEIRRMLLISRINDFTFQKSRHPLNIFLSRVAVLLFQLDERRIDQIWSELGPQCKTAIIEDFLKFSKAMSSLNFVITTSKPDNKCPSLHFVPGSNHALEIQTDDRFSTIARVFRTIIKQPNPTKLNFLAFIESLVELIESETCFDAVEIDVFNPLYALIESWEKAYIGSSNGANGEIEFCLIFVDDIKKALTDILKRITYDDQKKEGYLMVKRHPGQGLFLAKTNQSTAIAQKSRLRKIATMILAVSMVAFLIMVFTELISKKSYYR